MSSRFAHSVMQRELSTRVGAWARGRGRAGPEWRFWVRPPGAMSRYLVPDVGYLSYDRLPREARDEAEEPHLAPDVAFEILSPSERPNTIEHKIDVYLRSGSSLVAVVDPIVQTLRIIDQAGERLLKEDEVFEHPAMPNFCLNLSEVFAELDV